jgi:hypothetical protein
MKVLVVMIGAWEVTMTQIFSWKGKNDQDILHR